MGHAAGLAADLALRDNRALRDIDVASLQEMLHREKQATIYVSDVDPSSPEFCAVQWAGLRGLFSDLVDYRTARLSPAKRSYGLQYSEAFPNHQLDARQALDPATRDRWLKRLPAGFGARLQPAGTRGEFLLSAYNLFKRN
jgi:hypothetical protein